MKAYKVVYNHNGYEIEAGQNGWIPSRETAEKILKNKQNDSLLYRDCDLYITEKEVTQEDVPYRDINAVNREYNGKPVYNTETFYFDAAEPGDYVEDKIARDAGECVPTPVYSERLIQCGEPHDSAFDDWSKKWRSTHATFMRVTEDVWMYCGNCFFGKTSEPPKENKIPYVA